MSFSSGTFSLVAGNPVVTGTTISSTVMNNTLSDIATGLTTCLLKDGTQTATAEIEFAQGINSTLTTDATSKTTGAIITAGGLGVAKSAYIGTIAYVGGTTLGLGNFSLQVDGTGGASQLGIACKITTAANQNLDLWNAADAGDNLFANFRTETAGSGTQRGTIDYNRVGGAVRYNTTSDAIFKNKFGPAPVAVSKNIIMSAPISEWAWKDDPAQKKQISPLAQELFESGFRGAVRVGGNQQVEVNTGLLDGKGAAIKRVEVKYQPWGIDKTAFYSHLVVLAQDHEKRITALETIK